MFRLSPRLRNIYASKKSSTQFVFQNSAQASHSLLSNTSSPAAASTSSGPGSNQSSGSLRGVTVPQEIERMTFSYVGITTLFLTAQDMWEQAEEVAHRGSGENEQGFFFFF